MKKILIKDITLREDSFYKKFSFNESIGIVKILEKLRPGIIEAPPILNGRTDILLLRSVAAIVKDNILSCPVSIKEDIIKQTFDVAKEARWPRLNIIAPVSVVQMEYLFKLKPKAMLQAVENAVKCAVLLTSDVEVTLADATRAEEEFLYEVIRTSVSCGAKTITLCDSAGEMLPSEFDAFLNDIYDAVPEIKNVSVSMELADDLQMAPACTVVGIKNGITQVNTAIVSLDCAKTETIVHLLSVKADALDIRCDVDSSVVKKSQEEIMSLITEKSETSPFTGGTDNDSGESIELNSYSTLTDIKESASTLGYDLTDNDVDLVKKELKELPDGKSIGKKELDAIIANISSHIPETYTLKSYVVNNGNVIKPSAHIELYKDGELLSGICVGDGPIDAAFLAIENITGHHFELDDFQIQAVTRGHEAMGSSLVKLRHNGTLYSGSGISTDIIGASIDAYINALNKICFDEDGGVV